MKSYHIYMPDIEIIDGKIQLTDYGKFSQILLGMAKNKSIQTNELRNGLYRLIDDSIFLEKKEYFYAMLDELNFTLLLEESILDFEQTDITAEHAIFFNYSDCLLLTMDIINDCVDGITLYFNYKIRNEDIRYKLFNRMFISYPENDNVFGFIIGGSDGFKFLLSLLQEHGTFISPWTIYKDIIILNYMEMHDTNKEEIALKNNEKFIRIDKQALNLMKYSPINFKSI